MRPHTGRAGPIPATRSRSRWLLAAAAVLLCAPGAGAQEAPHEDESPKVVSRTTAGYSVDAYETDIVQLLSEVGTHAGFDVTAADGVRSPITLTLQDASLEELLRRVLRNENYVIVYKGGVRKSAISGDAIDRIFLLTPASDQSVRAGPVAGVSPLAGPGAQPPAARGEMTGGPIPQGVGDPDMNDLAARAARARARAEARRAAREGRPEDAATAQAAEAAAAAAAARMVEQPEDFTPPSIEGEGTAHEEIIPHDEGAQLEAMPHFDEGQVPEAEYEGELPEEY